MRAGPHGLVTTRTGRHDITEAFEGLSDRTGPAWPHPDGATTLAFDILLAVLVSPIWFLVKIARFMRTRKQP